jgi:DNA-binding MarR family transcriptional regulator
MTEVRWLDERERRMWLAFLAMRRRLDSAMEQQLIRDAGLSSADFQLLVPLSEAPQERMRARELRREVGWDRSRLAHQMRRMQERGLIVREECPTDARGTIVRLTPAGRRAIESAAPGHVATVRRYLVDLLTPEEIGTLTAVAERTLDRLDAEGPGPDHCG